MNKLLIISFIIFCMLSNSHASSIRKCRQTDGSILFTNKPCPIATRSFSSVFNNNRNRKVPPFRQANYVRLQNTMIQAKTADVMEQRAQVLIDKAVSLARQGKINNAYDMVAASYAKLSAKLKDKRWKGQPIEEYTLNIQGLFEEVLISQSTISSANTLEAIVQTAWNNYHAK